MVGMAGLYLYDSVLLLASNEALLTPGWQGRWRALFGADGFLVRRKEPCLPNPLLPHRPLFRFAWNMEGPTDSARRWSPPGQGYAILALPVWLMWLALFALIPLGLFSGWGHRAIAAGILLFYVNALLALGLVWLRRAAYGIDGRQFASLSVECLTCPPFAVNLIRRLSLALTPKEDFLCVIGQCLTGRERESALAQIIVRVKNEIDWEAVDSPRADLLHGHLQSLFQESDTCRALNS